MSNIIAKQIALQKAIREQTPNKEAHHSKLYELSYRLDNILQDHCDLNKINNAFGTLSEFEPDERRAIAESLNKDESYAVDRTYRHMCSVNKMCEKYKVEPMFYIENPSWEIITKQAAEFDTAVTERALKERNRSKSKEKISERELPVIDGLNDSDIDLEIRGIEADF